MTDNTEAVEKLAEIIRNDEFNRRYAATMAQAILAAIQADPLSYVKLKPLSWRMGFAHAMGITYYIVKEDDYVVLEKHQGSSVTKSAHENEEDAQDFANLDLCNRVKELF